MHPLQSLRVSREHIRLTPRSRTRWAAARVLIALCAILGLAGLVEAQSLGEVAAKDKERRKQSTQPARTYTDEALGPDGAASKAPPLAVGDTSIHFVETKLYFHYPPGTSLDDCLLRYKSDQDRQVGDRSAHCNCPTLSPTGIVVSVDLLGGEDRGEMGDHVSFGMDVRMGCRCPAPPPSEDTASQQKYSRFRSELRRLKKNCVRGRKEYCAPFEAFLKRFEELCSSRFAQEPSCRTQASVLRGAPAGVTVKLAAGAAAHRLLYTLPCRDKGRPTCEKCVQDQMESTDYAESVAHKRCQDAGYPTLVEYRNASCTVGDRGPEPVYETGCAP